MNVLPLFEDNVDELPIHTTVYRDSVECGDGSQSVEVDGKVPAMRRSNDHWYGEIAYARPAGAAPAAARRRGRRRIRRFTGSARTTEIPNADDNAGNDQHPEPPKTLRRLIRRRAGSDVATMFG